VQENLIIEELSQQVLSYAKEKRNLINKLRGRAEDWRWKANCSDIADAPANLTTCASEIEFIANEIDCFAPPEGMGDEHE